MKTGKFWTFNRVAGAVAASAIAVGGASLVGNALAADGTGTANATVVTPISIGNAIGSNSLRFGSFSTTAAGATLTIGTGGGRLITGGAIGVGTTQNDYGPATFLVTGQANLTYNVTLPNDGVVTITTGGASGPETMAVSNFTSDPAGSTGQLSNLGAQNLKVGARITTVASQATGLYTGAFTVTVEYN